MSEKKLIASADFSQSQLFLAMVLCCYGYLGITYKQIHIRIGTIAIIILIAGIIAVITDIKRIRYNYLLKNGKRVMANIDYSTRTITSTNATIRFCFICYYKNHIGKKVPLKVRQSFLNALNPNRTVEFKRYFLNKNDFVVLMSQNEKVYHVCVAETEDTPKKMGEVPKEANSFLLVVNCVLIAMLVCTCFGAI